MTVFSIQTLERAQIDAYLRTFSKQFHKACGGDWTAVKAFLLSVYDLKDLMSRPILLAMIKDTILSGEVDIRATDLRAGVAWLYETYTGANMDRDWQKGSGRRVLSIKGRQAFCEKIALYMLEQGTLIITKRAFARLAEEIIRVEDNLANGGKQDYRTEDVATDGRLGTFITIDPEGYRFSHKSFYEFFCARQLAFRESERHNIMSRIPLSTEILRFLGEFSELRPDLYTFCVSMFSRPKAEQTDVMVRNALGVAWMAAAEPKPGSVSGRRVDNMEVKNAFNNWVFVQSTFGKVQFIETRFEESRFRDVEMEECAFFDTTLQKSRMNVRLRRSAHFAGTSFDDCVSEFSGEGVRIPFYRCKLSNSTFRLSCSAALSECTVNNTVISLVDASSDLRLKSCDLSGCTVNGPSLPYRGTVAFEETKLINCRVSGVFISEDSFKRYVGKQQLLPAGVAFRRHESAATDLEKYAIKDFDFLFVIDDRLLVIGHEWWVGQKGSQGRDRIAEGLRQKYSASKGVPEVYATLLRFVDSLDRVASKGAGG